MDLRKPLALLVADFESSVLHAERIEDILLHVAAKLLAGDGFHRLAGEVEADAVFPFLARVEDERRTERGVRAGDDRRGSCLFQVARDVGAPEVVRAAGGVGKKMPERDVAARRSRLRIAVRVK